MSGIISADWIISILIIIGLILAIWAKATQQTIKELLSDLIELSREAKEGTVEEVIYNY